MNPYVKLALAFLITSQSGFAHTYIRGTFSCTLWATREDTNTLPKRVGATSFGYSMTYYYDDEAHDYKVVKETIFDNTIPLPLGTYLRKDNVFMGYEGRPWTAGVAPFPYLKKSTPELLALLTALGSKEVDGSDPYSKIRKTPDTLKRTFQQRRDNDFLFRVRETWQMHLPTDVKDGLSFHFNLDCNGRCYFGEEARPGFCSGMADR